MVKVVIKHEMSFKCASYHMLVVLNPKAPRRPAIISPSDSYSTSSSVTVE